MQEANYEAIAGSSLCTETECLSPSSSSLKMQKPVPALNHFRLILSMITWGHGPVSQHRRAVAVLGEARDPTD